MLGGGGFTLSPGVRIDAAEFAGKPFPQPCVKLHFNLHGEYRITDWQGNKTTEYHQQGFESEVLACNVQLANGDTCSTGAVTVIF